jgi:hypothetical protein
MDTYEKKYLKYKNKYLNLKNQTGGSLFGNFFKSKSQIELEKKQLLQEQLRKESNILKMQEETKVREIQEKEKYARKIKEQEELKHLKEEYKKIGYEFVPYQHRRNNLETPLDRAHFKFNSSNNLSLPPKTLNIIYLDESKNYIVGLKEKFINFNDKYYKRFIKLGYNYNPPRDAYYDYNQQKQFPAEPAYFFIKTKIIKNPHSRKIQIANKFYQAPPMPSFDTWEVKPDIKPELDYKKISNTNPEWDPQNDYFFIKEVWTKDLPKGNKEKIEEHDFDSELHRLTK